MKAKILRNTSIRGVPASAGDVVEVEPSDFALLKENNKAEVYVEPKPETKTKKG